MKAVLYNWALPDDMPVRPETCSSWCVECCDFNKIVCVLWLSCNNLIVMHVMENVKWKILPFTRESFIFS